MEVKETGSEAELFDGQEQAAPTPATVENREEPKEDPQQMISRLKAENDALRSVKVTVAAPAPAQPAAQAVQPLSAEQLQAQAEELGFTDPKQVESIGRIAAHVAAPAYHKVAVLEQTLKVERAVNAAKSIARSNDPQFGKIEGYVDEYLSEISAEDKSDPAKLNAHMERASFYARGKMSVAAGPQKGRQAPPPPTPRDDMNNDREVPTGPETYSTVDNKTSITIQKRNKPEIMKMHSHPAIEGAVQIDPKDEWRGPIFEKDLRRD